MPFLSKYLVLFPFLHKTGWLAVIYTASRPWFSMVVKSSLANSDDLLTVQDSNL